MSVKAWKEERDACDAPVWLSVEAAAGWSSGYNEAVNAAQAFLMVKVIDQFLEAYDELTLADVFLVFGEREARLVADARESLGRPLLGNEGDFA
jgi:hypothetical protein